uniref:Uncharacterized protein n=1 Tax=Trichuris muris TaxID=70415 RepID=A0A5S6QAP5_TRIMR
MSREPRSGTRGGGPKGKASPAYERKGAVDEQAASSSATYLSAQAKLPSFGLSFGKSENSGPQSYCMVDLRLYDRRRKTRAKRIAGKGYGFKQACVMQAYGEKALG